MLFLRIADIAEEEEGTGKDQNGTTTNGAVTNGNTKKLRRRQTTIYDSETNEYKGSKTSLRGLKLMWQQFYGLVVKRMIYTKRRYLLYGILGLVPALQCIIQQASKKSSFLK